MPDQKSIVLYSSDELNFIFESARRLTYCGQLKRSQSILNGLIEVSPRFIEAWIAKSAVELLLERPEISAQAAKAALRIEPKSAEALLILSSALLMQGDKNSAGTYLGEVGELLTDSQTQTPAVVRFYKMQLSRFSGV